LKLFTKSFAIVRIFQRGNLKNFLFYLKIKSWNPGARFKQKMYPEKAERLDGSK
jgi:hypothetical protein